MSSTVVITISWLVLLLTAAVRSEHSGSGGKWQRKTDKPRSDIVFISLSLGIYSGSGGGDTPSSSPSPSLPPPAYQVPPL